MQRLQIRIDIYFISPMASLNFNVGVLGHVDSGKTSLSKALSTVASTASFDKNPQSKERGITLDLGFSSFTVDIEESKKQQLAGYDRIQYTLVDCPGHASLIRTIIGGAQIIDLMLLVIDITKGMQTQTAECLIIGQVTCSHLMVVLNKVDLVPPDKQQATVDKMKKRLWKTLEGGRFAGCPIVAVAAKPGGPEASPEVTAVGVTELISALQQATYLPARSPDGSFVFAADHCFSIRGQGTVMTGTVLSGQVAVNDTVEIPTLGTSKKVKSMQMFRKPIDKIKQGDRAGICVTQFDPTQLERGLVCSPGALATLTAAVCRVSKIKQYKSQVCSKAKFHITIGHETVMGRLALFCCPKSQTPPPTDACKLPPSLDLSQEFTELDELMDESKAGNGGGDTGAANDQFALIELEKPVTCPPDSLIIGSRLDADVHTSACRLAFHGQILLPVTDPKYRDTVLPQIKVYKIKTREGQVERAPDKYSVIGKGLFKKETNLAAFANLRISLSTGEQGSIEGGFGQSGKIKIRIPEGLKDDTYQRYAGTGKKKGKNKDDGDGQKEEEASGQSEPVKIYLKFKRYVYDPKKAMIQS